MAGKAGKGGKGKERGAAPAAAPAATTPPASPKPQKQGAGTPASPRPATNPSTCTACAEWRIIAFAQAEANTVAPTAGACGPAAAHHAGQPHSYPTVQPVDATAPEMRALWARLPAARRRALLRAPRRDLFEKIRACYCSRCFGLFSYRYEELRT
jgi:hypothetical protein